MKIGTILVALCFLVLDSQAYGVIFYTIDTKAEFDAGTYSDTIGGYDGLRLAMENNGAGELPQMISTLSRFHLRISELKSIASRGNKPRLFSTWQSKPCSVSTFGITSYHPRPSGSSEANIPTCLLVLSLNSSRIPIHESMQV